MFSEIVGNVFLSLSFPVDWNNFHAHGI